MTSRFRLSLFVLAALAASQPGLAQPSPAPAAMPGMPMPPGDHGMMQAMEAMNRTMTAVPMTGDPDRDFVTMMVPHHQGAIDMSRIYLRDGKDPAIRKMAQVIIVGQEREIRAFKAWLARHPAPAR